MEQQGGRHLGRTLGGILNAIAAAFDDAGIPDAAAVAAGVAAGSRDIADYGKAEVGDKTMIDALVPFSAALAQSLDAGAGLADAWVSAAAVATRAAAQTADLLPRMGRARTHGQNSVGTPDPGAVSLAYIVTAVGATLASGVRDAAPEAIRPDPEGEHG